MLCNSGNNPLCSPLHAACLHLQQQATSCHDAACLTGCPVCACRWPSVLLKRHPQRAWQLLQCAMAVISLVPMPICDALAGLQRQPQMPLAGPAQNSSCARAAGAGWVPWSGTAAGTAAQMFTAPCVLMPLTPGALAQCPPAPNTSGRQRSWCPAASSFGVWSAAAAFCLL